MKHSDSPIFARLALAGILTAFAAVLAPQIMGQGYNTVNDQSGLYASILRAANLGPVHTHSIVTVVTEKARIK